MWCILGGFDGEVHLFHVSGKRLVKKFIHSQPTKVSEEKLLGTEGAKLPIPPRGENHGNEDDEWEDEDEENAEKEMNESVECVGISRTEIR